MAKAKSSKKTVRKTAKPARKTKPSAAKKKRVPPPRTVSARRPASKEKGTVQKERQIAGLKKELAKRDTMLKESVRTLKEAIARAEKEVSQSKKKAGEELRVLQRNADAEMKKLQKEISAKEKALQEKDKELEACRKTSEVKTTETRLASPPAAPPPEKTGLVAFKGNPITLLGPEIKVGDRAPQFQVVDNGMQPVNLGRYAGQIKIISSVPSLDTPVCSMETRRFNEEAEKLPEKVSVLTISMDLPFAQARWCAAAGVEKVKTFSDYQDRSFGMAYGVLIKELKLLARTIFIVDGQDVVRYVEVVPEIGKEPNYEEVLNAARALL